MKILLLTTIYPEETRPDLKKDTKAIHYFTKQWVKAGHEVIVLHMYLHPVKKIYKFKPKTYSRKIQKSEVDGVELWLMENQLMWPKAGNLTKFHQRQASKHINNYLKEYKPNFKPDVMLVHFPSYLKGVVEKINVECPRVAILHQTDLRINKGRKSVSSIEHTFKPYKGIGFRAPYIQEFFQTYIKDNLPKFIAYSGIPRSYITNYETLIKSKEHKNSDTLNILYAGSLIKRKNVDTIIKALYRLSQDIDFHFTIVGDNGEIDELVKLVKSYGLEGKITFTGNLARKDVLKEMRKNDVFVMVSHSETFGLVYLEAMSQGCITIGSKGEGIDGVIKDGVNGFLIKPKDIESLKERIHTIFSLDTSSKKSIIKSSVETAQKMSDEIMAEEYLSSVRKIIEL